MGVFVVILSNIVLCLVFMLPIQENKKYGVYLFIGAFLLLGILLSFIPPSKTQTIPNEVGYVIDAKRSV